MRALIFTTYQGCGLRLSGVMALLSLGACATAPGPPPSLNAGALTGVAPVSAALADAKAAGAPLAGVTPAKDLIELPSRIDPMPLGEVAPAPPGFLAFCARRPDQCGLDGEVDVATRQRQLYQRYYWSIAFAHPDASDASRPPAAGPQWLQPAVDVRTGAADPATGARTDDLLVAASFSAFTQGAGRWRLTWPGQGEWVPSTPVGPIMLDPAQAGRRPIAHKKNFKHAEGG